MSLLEVCLSVSVFRIPPGHALHTHGDAIHNDGFLTGHWIVILTPLVKYFSTVIVKNEATGKRVDVSVKPLLEDKSRDEALEETNDAITEVDKLLKNM